MRISARRLMLPAFAAVGLTSSLVSCGSSSDSGDARTKNVIAAPDAPAAPDFDLQLAPTTTLPTPSAPDRTLTAPDGASFGTRVAVDRAMVFASSKARPTATKGVVYTSSFSDAWSTPREIIGSWDFYFGRDIDVNDQNVIASAGDTRSGLFGDRIGEILIGKSPQSSITNTSPRLGFNARSGDDLGAAVALSDNYMAVSAPAIGRYTTPTPTVFIMPLRGVSLTITSVDAGGVATNGTFGTAIDMDDSTLVIGASGALGGDGAVFVFNRSGETWSLAQRLDGTNNESFGADVNIVGSRMVIGAPAAAQGAVHVCERSSGTWTCPTRIDHPDGSATGQRAFGAAVDLSSDGNELIVGAPWSLGMTCCPGAAFTYVLRDAAWVLARSLQPASPTNGDGFGNSVGIDDGVAVVGAPRASGGAGTVSVFGSPDVGHRAPRAVVDFTEPTTGAMVRATINFFGDAPSGYDGSLQAWSRAGNSWRSTFDPDSRSFDGSWPDAESAYGSLTVLNQFGYESTALSTRIVAPAPTTMTTSIAPMITAPASTSESTPTPIAPTRSTVVGSNTSAVATTTTQATLSAPNADQRAGQSATVNAPTAPSTRPGATARPSAPAASPQPATTPSVTSFTVTCRVGQPCPVEIPALLGGKTASMRGAPPGLRYNVKTATIVGSPRKRGSFSIVVQAGANGKTGSATVNLTVK